MSDRHRGTSEGRRGRPACAAAPALALACGTALLLLAGCVSAPRVPAHYYFQRTPIRVAVMPSGNTTDNPEASIIFDKACEEALRKKGFEVVSADQVVTYAAASGLSLRDLPGRKAGEVGRDLKVDMLFYTEITRWKTEYVVVQGRSAVAGRSRLVEVSTEALVWRLPWQIVQQSGNGGGNGVVGLLVEAAVQAVVDSAFDRCTQLGQDAARYAVGTLPHPGFAPPEPPP